MSVDKKVVDEQIAALGDFYQWFTKKERDYLHEVIVPGEKIHALTSGMLDGNTWLVTVTDKRVLFLDKGMVYGLKQMELPLSHVSSVSHKTGLVFGKIEVSTAGGAKTIDMIQKGDVPKVAKIISELINTAKGGAEFANADKDDLLSQLERLAALKQSGCLSDEEFALAKQSILSK